MRIGGMALMACLLVGCATGYEADVQRIQEAHAVMRQHPRVAATYAEHLRVLYETPAARQSRAIRDSLLQLGPSIRYHSDSLARVDSAWWGWLLMGRVADLYYYRDTVMAVYAYLEAWPWTTSWSQAGRVEEQRRFAETLGDAINVTQSPYIAKMAYPAFERAKQMALAYGDSQYYRLADSSYRAVAGQVLTMPDSIRVAFGPPPDRPARVPWVLVTLAAAFIAIGVAGGWGGKATVQALLGRR